jgi:hypothetical protein
MILIPQQSFACARLCEIRLLYHPSGGFKIATVRAQAAAIAAKMIDKNHRTLVAFPEESQSGGCSFKRFRGRLLEISGQTLGI